MTDCPYCSPDMDTPICGQSIRVPRGWSLVCTRAENHTGQHVACGAHHNIATSSTSDKDNQKP